MFRDVFFIHLLTDKKSHIDKRTELSEKKNEIIASIDIFTNVFRKIFHFVGV